jgi:hypothetical protein
MRQWMRNVLLLVASVLVSPMAVTAQHAAPEPPQPPDPADHQIIIDRARALAHDARARAEIAAQGAAAGVDGDGKARVNYWAARGGKKEKAAYLGVTATAADPALRDQLKLPRGNGLVIQTVGEDTPAAAAGLQQHDVITKLDDQWLVGQNQLGVLIRMHKAGDEITLTGVRQGSPITLKAKLGEKEMVISEADGSVVPQAFGGDFTVAVPNMQGLLQLERMPPVWAEDDDAALIIKENDQTLKISVKEGERHLVATDNNEQVLFDGPVETEEQRKALPADLAEKLTKYQEQFDQVKEKGPGNRVRIIKDR